MRPPHDAATIPPRPTGPMLTVLPQSARIARRELRGGLRGFGIFLACLALGVAAIAAIGSTRAAIEAGLAREGAALLGGNAELSFTYRFASAKERAWMQSHSTALSEIADFRSMATVQGDSALTQVKSVDAAYPLVGTVSLSPDIPLATALASQGGTPGAVMAPVLADRLGLSPGDEFTLGGVAFRLSARLIREPDNATGGFTLGPPTIVATSALKGTPLLASGTLFTSKYRLTVPPGTNLKTLKHQAKTAMADAGLRWRDARNGAPGVARFVDRLSSFLILVGLSGLAVGGIGVSAAVRSYLASRVETIATLRTLGAANATIFTAYALQIAALSVLGIVIGLALGGIGPLLLAPLIEARLPVPAHFSIYPRPLAEAALYGALTAALFTLWPLARTESVRAATLFRDALSGARRLPRWPYLLATALLLGALLASASLLTGSAQLTLWAAAGLAGALALLALSARLTRILTTRARPLARGRPALRWALAAIASPRSEALPVILSLGLGLSVLAAVGQISGNLRGAIARDLPKTAPSYFLIDIQKDQITPLLAMLHADPAISKTESAPMLRGVLSRINGEDARKVAGNHWVVRGDRGISYAAAKPPGSHVTSGKWWPPDYTGPPQMSFAREEAEEIGLHLGDKITLNILGRDITAEITSLRDVDFSSAGMGFVMVLNKAAIAAAPHSFIATVYTAPKAEARVLREIAKTFPNVTAIAVKDAIKRVSDMLSSVAAATAWGASVALITGFLVLIGGAASGAAERAREAAVLKTLGASRARILLSFLIRAALLGLAASVVALGAGLAGGWAVNHFVFDVAFQPIWSSGLVIIAGGVLANLAAQGAFAARALSARPARILRARE